MNRIPPHTPFSTPFSSPKKLLETRIRNILTGPQKRPPLPLLALVLAFCFFSVNLVSCQPTQTEETPDSSSVSLQNAVPDEEAALHMAKQLSDYELDQPHIQVRFSAVQGDKRLILFEAPSRFHAGGFSSLVAGVWDDAAETVSGEVYISPGDGGRWASWTEGDAFHLLLANYYAYQGIETGTAPVWLRFADGVLEYPPLVLPDAAREAVPDLPDDAVFFDFGRTNYWIDHKAIPVEGGLEFYTAQEDYWAAPLGNPRAKWRFTGLIPLSDTAAFPAKGPTAGEAIRAVLQGEAGFRFHPDETEPVKFLTIHDVPTLVDVTNDDETKIPYFAAADLDGDGEQEAILWVGGTVNASSGFVVLHHENGTVRGYTTWYRSFQDLKADGTYSYSAGGPLEGIVSKTTFTTSSRTTELFAYSDFDGDWDGITYFVDNEQVTEEEFLAAFDRQNAKPDAQWYEFTEANIAAVFS